MFTSTNNSLSSTSNKGNLTQQASQRQLSSGLEDNSPKTMLSRSPSMKSESLPSVNKWMESEEDVEGIGHMWRRLSLHDKKSLYRMFPHLCTATKHLGLTWTTSEDILESFSSTNEPSFDVWKIWKDIVTTHLAPLHEASLSHNMLADIFHAGVDWLQQNQWFQVFFLVDILHGFHTLSELHKKYQGNLKKITPNMIPNRSEDIVLKDLIVLIAM